LRYSWKKLYEPLKANTAKKNKIKTSSQLEQKSKGPGLWKGADIYRKGIAA